MILSKPLTGVQIAGVVGCSTRSVRTIRTTLRCFGAPKAPANGVGRPKNITPPMLRALCDRLIEKPHMYQDEMVVFLWDEFNILVTTHNISRALKRVGWFKKTARRVAQERSADLQDLYLHNFSDFCSYHLVYIDESGCDRRVGFRRTGWSPLEVSPVQIARFHRGRRYRILPHIRRTVLSSLRRSKAPRTVLCSSSLLRSCFPIAGDGLSRNRFS